jgi:formate dehydrogenase major subunit
MRPGAGAYPLRGHNNVQGASDMGPMPDRFPGYQFVSDPEIRARFEKGWNTSLSPNPGLDNHDMVEAIHAGQLKAMYMYGEEMSLVDSNLISLAARSRNCSSL